MTEIETGKVEKAIEKDDIVLLLSGSEEIEEVKLEMMKDLENRENTSIIYVSITRPYGAITDILDEKGIETDEMFFIDCMSKSDSPDNAVRAKNCVFVDPDNLTNLSISISEAVEGLPDEEEILLVFDTLSALRVHNDDEPLQEFSSFLTQKIRNWEIKSVILTLEEEMEDDMIVRVSQFCDCKIRPC